MNAVAFFSNDLVQQRLFGDECTLLRRVVSVDQLRFVLSHPTRVCWVGLEGAACRAANNLKEFKIDFQCGRREGLDYKVGARMKPETPE